METPSSARRVSRSQTMAALNNSNVSKKVECSEYLLSQSRRRNPKQQDLSEKKQKDPSMLVDITNDSPIVGLALGNLETPLSSMSKQRSIRANKTPGSGEALLRGQVKTLLQKVEEEAEFSKLSLESRPFLHLRHLVNSPIGLLAPTPANTPQIPILPHVNPSEIVEEKLIYQETGESFYVKDQDILESDKSLITILDFSENTESVDESSVCSSGLTYEGGEGENESTEKQSTIDDDNSSTWSIQVNASTHEEDDDEEEGLKEQGEESDDSEEEEEEEDGDEMLLEELCRGMNRISVNEKGISAMFEGKHTRFVYDSDDEVAEEELGETTAEEDLSPSVVRLKGVPTPQGKHLRFSLEDEDMDA